MFKLYYFYDRKTPQLIFTHSELTACSAYIKCNNLTPQMCIIVSPNNRRITFNKENEMIFGNPVAA